MDNKITLNKNNNDDEYDILNQNILEQAILLQMTSEIRALNMGIIPKMDVVKKIHLIEPEWNEVHQNQICSRIFQSSLDWDNSNKINSKSRHLQIKYYHTKHSVQEGVANLEFVAGEDNDAEFRE